MNVKNWTVCIIEPNKFEAQVMIDLLRYAGVDRYKLFSDSAEALDALELYPANIILGAVEMTPVDGPSWTRSFRRNQNLANRKAPVFLTSHAFSRSMAEECRHAGVNALIGKPISGKILLATINKVLANPRPFIDAPGYVGPCRRAGIVTAGAPKRRRKADETKPAAAEVNTLASIVAGLANAVTQLMQGAGKPEVCEAALKQVQAYAVNAGDGPMMRACAAFALQLGARDLRPDAVKAALTACVAGVSQLAELAVSETEKRERVAEGVRQAVAKAASLRAA